MMDANSKYVNGSVDNTNEDKEKSEIPDNSTVSSVSTITTKAEGTGTHFVPGSKDDPHRSYRIGKQCLLVLCWIGIGFYNEIVGPTLPDLKDRIGVNYEVVSRALVAKSVGSMVGAISGGFLHERYYKHSELIIAAGLWLGAVSTVIIPFGKHLAVVGTMFALSGVSEGLINAGGNTIVMDLWGERAAGPMHSLHFGFAAGALIAPQLALPFLSPDARDQSEDLISTETPTTLSWNVTSLIPEESRIEIAYGIVAAIVFIFGFIVLGIYLKGPPENFVIRKPSENWKEMLHPSSCGHGYVFYSVELIVMLFLYFIQTVGGEKAMGKFLFSYAVESDVQFTKKDASSLQTAFWGSFTAGRFLGIPLGRFIPIWVLIMCDSIGAVIVAVLMSVYGQDRLGLWVTASFMGFFISVAFPNGMSWANIYLDMNNVSVMILIIGGACGGFIYQYLTGYLFERDPHNLPYVMIGYGSCLLICFIIMQILATVHGRKILKKTEKKVIEDEIIVIGGDEEKLAIDNRAYIGDENTRL